MDSSSNEEYYMKYVIDGNDGTGKSSIVTILKGMGYKVSDRGIPTKMTDNMLITPKINEFYIILDADVETCQKRLLEAGKDLDEKYHRLEDLIYYRERFLDVAKKLGDRAVVVDSSGSLVETLKLCLSVIVR
jgi:thymidylate kinase